MHISKILTALAVAALLCYGLAACNKPAATDDAGAKVPSNTIAASAEPQTAGSDVAGATGTPAAGGKCAECAAGGKAACTCAEGGCKGENCANCPAKGAAGAAAGGSCPSGGSCANCPGKGGEAAAPAGAAEAGSIKLSDGSAVQLINVGLLDGDYKNHAGLVAIDGEVAQVFADKGTFMLKNCVDASMKASGCSKPCCGEAQIPVKVDMTKFSGVMPEAGADVVVIGDVSVTETGYTLAVREVRSGEQTILSLKT